MAKVSEKEYLFQRCLPFSRGSYPLGLCSQILFTDWG
jgi:hypothetical protein